MQFKTVPFQLIKWEGEFFMAKGRGKRVKNERAAVQEKYSLNQLFKRFLEGKMAEGRTSKALDSYRVNFNFFMDSLSEKKIESIVTDLTVDVICNYIISRLNEKIRLAGHQFKDESEKALGLFLIHTGSLIGPI